MAILTQDGDLYCLLSNLSDMSARSSPEQPSWARDLEARGLLGMSHEAGCLAAL